jgi:eukaryotic-like serine/threonine-protein kinase
MPNEEGRLYEFGPFRIDPGQRLLERDRQPVPLQPKAFDTLLTLVRNCEKVVLKDDLMKSVWPDTFVEESNLTQNIFLVRKALEGAPGDRRYIVTVSGRGYRFTEKVRTVSKDEPGEDEVAMKNHSPSQLAVVEAIAPIPPVHKPFSKTFIAVLAAVLVLAGIVYRYSPRPHKLTNIDTVVLADFVNKTGDPVFDGTLRQGLSAQLEQSPFLNLVSDQRIAQTMKLMAKPTDARLTDELAREVCQRTASAATVQGSIAMLGSQYVLGLKAVACRTGDLLAEEQVTANAKERVLKALGEAASKLRGKLGESLPSLEKYDVPPESVTTPSLEALQAYTWGYRALAVRNDSTGAIPLFLTAVSLDPDFAVAYARLGSCYLNVGETTRAADNTRKAYQLRERTSEMEKLYIAAHYQVFVTGNLEAARQVYELWAQTYPRDYGPHNELGLIYKRLGEYDKGVKQAQEALTLNSDSAQVWANLGDAYMNASRLDEARATIQKAQAKNLDTSANHFNMYVIDFMQHDAAGMEKESAGLIAMPGYRDRVLHAEADTAAYSGMFARAREISQQAVESATRADKKETAAGYLASDALQEALAGNASASQQQARAAVALASGRVVDGRAAVAMALTGDSAQATQLATGLNAQFPEDTGVQYGYLPMIQGAIALRAGDARKSVEALSRAAPFEAGTLVAFLPVYLRGEALLAAKDGASAAREFQKILDHSAALDIALTGALAHLGLGRAFALSGDTEKAKAAYEDFLALWSNADSDMPTLKLAKAEYSKLKNH